ncbi:KAP family P-loop domain-containing protein [Lachnospiraceae bacterium]|nr:KAP family P-loop domain-containing protein [Lachnospiraceae bacterium]
MNYSSDRAIKSIDEDLLGRADFSKQLGRAIYENKEKESIVIALYGKWGSGKTSVANMALQTMEELALEDKNKPVIIKFAPWNYSDKDSLIARFFSSLKSKIDIDGSDELKNVVGKALSEYADVFEFATLVPVVGGPLAAFLKKAAQVGGEALAKPSDLETSKAALEEALLKVDQKIVILIDDIDRLTNQQIRDIFQLVKQVGDLPNITYLLAMDREIVRRALSEIHNTDGNEYLEKIVQIPFEIPELNRTKLHEIFFTKLDTVIKDLSKDIQLDQRYWSRVFENCISPYICTLRDVNRVINTFQFRYSMLYEETSFEDMIAITTLEVLIPTLYKWIAENQEAVCGGMRHSFLSSQVKRGTYRKRYEEEFRLLGVDSEKAIKSVAAIFPIFAKDVEENFYGSEFNKIARMKMRAAQPDRFELYFMVDMEKVQVPRTVINRCAFSLNEEELKKTISDINSKGNIIYFIDEIQSMIDIIPEDRLSLLSGLFLDMRYDLKGLSGSTIFTTTAGEKARYCAENMIRKLRTEEERYGVYLHVLKQAGKESLGTIAYEIRDQECAYGRFTDIPERKEEQIISFEKLLELEKAFLKKINKLELSSESIEEEDFIHTFCLWEDLDKESANKFLKKALENIVSKLKFLCIFAGRWNGTNGSGWIFNKELYQEYFTEEDMLQTITEMDKTNLNRFNRTEQLKLATFVLNYKKDTFDRANEQKAMALIEEWRHCCNVYEE